ncbi:MAG TPA: T9SS type A sorting domain-containing protein [Saprospiraceae bacterium]|nr:T9SS type A sorting domain-containing protein [Saprospiraceae bacterium]
MKFLQFFVSFCLLQCISISLSAQAAGFAAAVDSAVAPPNQVVCVPLRSVGFTDVVSFQFGLQWDADILSFHHLENYQLPDWDETDFNDFQPNCLLTGWASITGLPVTKPDGTALVDICFTTISAPGTGSDIVLGDCFPPGNGGNEAFNFNNQNIWNPSQFINGRIDIGPAPSSPTTNLTTASSSFKLQPNPSTSATTLILNSPEAGNGIIRVTNLAGQLVWEQNINYRSGQNQFPISGDALTNGLFLVTLETAQGLSTRFLCINK